MKYVTNIKRLLTSISSAMNHFALRYVFLKSSFALIFLYLNFKAGFFILNTTRMCNWGVINARVIINVTYKTDADADDECYFMYTQGKLSLDQKGIERCNILFSKQKI